MDWSIGARGPSSRDWEREFSRSDLIFKFGSRSENWEAEAMKLADRIILL